MNLYRLFRFSFGVLFFCGKIVLHWVGIGHKKLIVRLYMAKKEQNLEIKYKELMRDSGIGRDTIKNTITVHKRTGIVLSPNKKRKRKTIFDTTEESTRDAIKKKVHDFWHRSEIPTLPKILTVVNQDPEMPNYSRTTIHRILKKLSFRYIVQKRNNTLTERNDIILRRKKVFAANREVQARNEIIYYLNETWLNAGDYCKKVWLDAYRDIYESGEEQAVVLRFPSTNG